MKREIIKRWFGGLAVASLLVAGCSPKEQESAKEVSKVHKVKVEEVIQRDVEQVYQFSGKIEPMVKNSISSAAAQRVEKVYAYVGDRVKKGDLLVEMEDINHSQLSIQLTNLQNDLMRMEALYKVGGVSEQQYEQLKTQVEVMSENLENIAKNTKLRSPIDGVVAMRNFDDGDLAVGQPILVVMQIDPVKILVNISEEFFPQVKVGLPVKVELDIYPQRQFMGRVVLIHPTMDPMTRSFSAEVRIENRESLIRPGMFARAYINFGSRSRVVVPDIAVVKQPGTNSKYLYVMEGDRVAYRKVELGRRIGNIYEVLEGVAIGEKVVVAGFTGLREGMEVTPVEGGVDLSLQ